MKTLSQWLLTAFLLAGPIAQDRWNLVSLEAQAAETGVSQGAALPEAALRRARLGELHFGPRVGGTQGQRGKVFVADFLADGTTLLAVQLNLATNALRLTHALRFTLRTRDGTLDHVTVGASTGSASVWSAPFPVPPGARLIGISGAGGWFIDALRFHFSDGSVSPRWGGPGGDSEFQLLLPKRGSEFVGEVRGLWGTLDQGVLETVGLLTMPANAEFASAPSPAIELWHGREQRFGEPGVAQRWVNLLGNVRADSPLVALTCSLNGGNSWPLSVGPDNHRLASLGDFNVELATNDLRPGANTVMITATDALQRATTARVTVHFTPGHRWPLPYAVDFRAVTNLTAVAQVVDGDWRLTGQGVRTASPYYDRVLAFGDASWTNFEATARFILHGFTGPHREGPWFGVSHVALAFRWPGHTADGKQPSEQWWPLGAQAEFMLATNLAQCRWRILPDRTGFVTAPAPTPIETGVPCVMKGRVETLADGRTHYRVKLWREGDAEPANWQVENTEGPDDLPGGAFLFNAHHSDVTFVSVKINPL